MNNPLNTVKGTITSGIIITILLIVAVQIFAIVTD